MSKFECKKEHLYLLSTLFSIYSFTTYNKQSTLHLLQSSLNSSNNGFRPKTLPKFNIYAHILSREMVYIGILRWIIRKKTTWILALLLERKVKLTLSLLMLATFHHNIYLSSLFMKNMQHMIDNSVSFIHLCWTQLKP